MIESLKVAVLPSDMGACASYRCVWPAEAVSQVRPGWDIRAYRPKDVEIAMGPKGEPVAFRGVDLEGVDLVVTQRVGRESLLGVLGWMQKRGIAVVVDNDDAMWCIDRENTAWAEWNGRTASKTHYKIVDAATEMADVATVTTPFLANRYGKHGRVEVLPNRIPEAAMREPQRSDFGTIRAGWSGFTKTHPRDLLVVGDAPKRYQEDMCGRIQVLGDAEGAARIWDTRVKPLDPAPLGKGYYDALSEFDIGMVPLELSRFNQGKSSLKALEFAAAGAAVIASPTPANQAFAREVPIALAKDPSDWYFHMARMAADPHRLEEIWADQQQAMRRSGWVMEDRAEDWASAWERAVQRRAKIKTL
jgi:hypothetical protein